MYGDRFEEFNLVEEEGEHGENADDVDELLVPHLAHHFNDHVRVLEQLARAAPRVENHHARREEDCTHSENSVSSCTH